MRTPGDVIDGRYVVREMLGRGGMADVFRATDSDTDRGVAIKVLRSVEPGSARRFRAEVEVLSRLDHPGLLKLRGSGTHEGVPYFVLDLADGPSLAGELAGGPVGLDRALAVGEEVADVLAYAHRAGIVHRDVKPSNILFDDLGRARLADFGIARLAGTPSLTRTGQIIGSAPYLAPEQVVGERAGPEADVYSLGLVMIECVSGRLCYPGTDVEAALCRLHRPPGIPSDLPGWSRDVLAAMLARDPIRRPDADAVADALRRGTADPVLAATAPHGVDHVDAVAALPDVLAATAKHLHPRHDFAAGSTVIPQQTAPVHGTALAPHGARPQRSARRPRAARQFTTLLATAVIAVVLMSVLGLMVAGDEPPAGRRPAGAGPTPSNTMPQNAVAPTTANPTLVAPIAETSTTVASAASAPPATTSTTATPTTATSSTAVPTTAVPTTATPTTATPTTAAAPTTAPPTTAAATATTVTPLQQPVTNADESPAAQGQESEGGNG